MDCVQEKKMVLLHLHEGVFSPLSAGLPVEPDIFYVVNGAQPFCCNLLTP
jgi:hypothetical protein